MLGHKSFIFRPMMFYICNLNTKLITIVSKFILLKLSVIRNDHITIFMYNTFNSMSDIILNRIKIVKIPRTLGTEGHPP
jgi:hypothetical protein